MDVRPAPAPAAAPKTALEAGTDAFLAALAALEIPHRGVSRFGCCLAYELMSTAAGLPGRKSAPDFVVILRNDVPDDVLARIPASFDFGGSTHTVFVSLVNENPPGRLTPSSYVLPGRPDVELEHAAVRAEADRRGLL